MTNCRGKRRKTAYLGGFSVKSGPSVIIGLGKVQGNQRLSPIGTQCEPMGLKLLWGKESVGYGVAISHWFWDYMRHKAEGADHIQE